MMKDIIGDKFAEACLKKYVPQNKQKSHLNEAAKIDELESNSQTLQNVNPGMGAGGSTAQSPRSSLVHRDFQRFARK